MTEHLPDTLIDDLQETQLPAPTVLELDPTTKTFMTNFVQMDLAGTDYYLKNGEEMLLLSKLERVIPAVAVYPKVLNSIPAKPDIQQFLKDQLGYDSNFEYPLHGELLLIHALFFGNLDEFPHTKEHLQLLKQHLKNIQQHQSRPDDLNITFDTRLIGALLFPEEASSFQFAPEELEIIKQKLSEVDNPAVFKYNQDYVDSLLLLQLLHPDVLTTMPFYQSACDTLTKYLQEDQNRLKSRKGVGFASLTKHAYYLKLLLAHTVEMTAHGLEILVPFTQSTSIPEPPQEYV